jgi:hypothetical protein
MIGFHTTINGTAKPALSHRDQSRRRLSCLRTAFAV